MSKVWLITGSGSGLGRRIAEAALEGGNQVVATARDTSDLAGIESGMARTFARGMTSLMTQGQVAVRAAVERFGRLDVLVNNAGYGDTRPFEQVPSNEFRKLVDTCLFGVVNLTRAALPVMRKQRSGHIIQISSLGGRTAFPGNAAYFASNGPWAVSPKESPSKLRRLALRSPRWSPVRCAPIGARARTPGKIRCCQNTSHQSVRACDS